MSRDTRQFLEAISRELPEQPESWLEESLVARLAATARAQQSGGAHPGGAARARGRRGRFAIPARIALAACGLLLCMAGLAVAGVDLPGPVASGFDKVGIALPNQGPAAKKTDEGGTAAGAPEPDSGGSEQNPAGSGASGASAQPNGARHDRGEPAKRGSAASADQGSEKSGKAHTGAGKSEAAPGQQKGGSHPAKTVKPPHLATPSRSAPRADPSSRSKVKAGKRKK